MSFSEGYRAPRVRDIGLALLIGVALLIAFLKLGDVVKGIGAVLYYIPARLGLVQQAGSGDVQRYSLNTMPELVSFSEPGRYALYTGDYDLLSITDAIKEGDNRPWVTIKLPETGQPLPIEYVDRGMRIYDSHVAPGRPVMTWIIPRSGFYLMEHTRRPALIGIVRDYSTGNEKRIAAVFAVEIALAAAPFVILFGGSYWRKREAYLQMQRARRAEADAAFRSLTERRAARAAADADDPHAPFRPKD